jgi:hypothetical protein
LAKLLIYAGIAIAALCPLLFGLGVLMSEVLFPSCTASKTFAACSLFGFNVYGFMELCYVWGFVGSIFLVPVGFVVLVIGALVER